MIVHQRFLIFIIYSIVFPITIQTAHAQLFTKKKVRNLEDIDKYRFTYGYHLGFNAFDFKMEYKQDDAPILVDDQVGLNVGLMGNMNINKFLDLRIEPGLYFTSRTLYFPSSSFNGIALSENDLKREIKSTYLYLPLVVKFTAKRFNNFRPYISGGIAYGLNLSSNEKSLDDNSSGKFRLKSNNYFYEIGFGVDLYLYWFKLTPAIKGIFALNNENVPDNDPNSPWTSNINIQQTRALVISFTFQ